MAGFVGFCGASWLCNFTSGVEASLHTFSISLLRLGLSAFLPLETRSSFVTDVPPSESRYFLEFVVSNVVIELTLLLEPWLEEELPSEEESDDESSVPEEVM